ncbi:MAG TPA: sigma-54 dependent transcriptional regulator [Blastocatellia bacterium]|nr:sigma-54 dependent transcriptional regulator [Blastocatellia bacterium]
MLEIKPGVLIVDDEAAARYGMRRALEKEGYGILEAESTSAAEAILNNSGPDMVHAVLLDMRLNQESGVDYLPVITARQSPPAVIVVTAHGSDRLAVKTMKAGAYDYLAKPFDVAELRLIVRNAVEATHLRRENELLREELTGQPRFGCLIGDSGAIKKVYALIEKVAETDASVLILGESGTGKELVAREIHRRSRRAGDFVAVNCAAIPQELIESELFGHEKGAFTGATGRRIGKLESAHGGSLFLDEVGDMALSAQAKLLRVLEEREFHRLGGNEVVSTDVRLISATNKQLQEVEVPSGRFREDLYYRICVVTLALPPLRARKSDIPALAQAFAQRYGLAYKGRPIGISESTYKVFLEYEWPGNIRQLRNCIERAVVLSETGEITVDVLPEEIAAKRGEQAKSSESEERILVPSSLKFSQAKKEFEKLYIEKCLSDSGGNITRAAAALGMHRQSLQHKIKELGLTKRFVLSE